MKKLLIVLIVATLQLTVEAVTPTPSPPSGLILMWDEEPLATCLDKYMVYERTAGLWRLMTPNGVIQAYFALGQPTGIHIYGVSARCGNQVETAKGQVMLYVRPNGQMSFMRVNVEETPTPTPRPVKKKKKK